MTPLLKVLEELVEKCNRCPGGDCSNCGQRPLNIEIAKAAILKLIPSVDALAAQLFYFDHYLEWGKALYKDRVKYRKRARTIHASILKGLGCVPHSRGDTKECMCGGVATEHCPIHGQYKEEKCQDQ